MLYSFNLISHPDRTLKEHLNNCNLISEKLLEMKNISGSFFGKEELQLWRKALVYFHDLGKATDFFQHKIIEAAIIENISDFLEKNNEYITFFQKEKKKSIEKLLETNNKLSNHSRVGAYFLWAKKITTDEILNLILFKIVLCHHGDLSNFQYSDNKCEFHLDEWRKKIFDQQIFQLNFDSFNTIIQEQGFEIGNELMPEIEKFFTKQRTIKNVVKKIEATNDLKYFFLQHFLYSLLLSADKGDMMLSLGNDKKLYIRENISLPENIIENYKQKIFRNNLKKPIDIEREKAYQNIEKNILAFSEKSFFSITLPTGLGKTFSAYNAAIKLQNTVRKNFNYSPRIIYCLPFTSIIDQNAQIFSDIISSEGLEETILAKHHYLSSYNEKYDKTQLSYEASEYLTEGWEQEIIITTFVQLLESIFTNKNRALRKFHNMANAIIIIDEVQNIPPKYYEAIETVFQKMAEFFHTKFILVSATQPVIFSKNNVIELTDPSKVLTRYFFEINERIELNQTLLKQQNYEPQDIEYWLDIFVNDIAENSNKSFLIICNTIANSQKVFEEIRKIFEDETVLYLSSSILPKRRKQLIKLIQRNIKRQKRQILVTTQVVEAGVDIDFDVVYRDFAPLDSINQSAGRCNRNGVKGKGTVKLFNTGKAKYIYDTVLLNITLQILKSREEIVLEKHFYELNLQYFNKIRENISAENDTSKDIIENLQNLNVFSMSEKFKLINEAGQYYNVFIPYQKRALKIWKQYMECIEIEGDFERKRAIKKIKPDLMQYVTRFPSTKYNVEKERAIYYEKNWTNFYNLTSGFIAGEISVII